jgi:hypothetical protein
MVELACLAPSVHNTQPWTWVVQDQTLRLYADTKRQLMYADSKRRDLVISCGAALHQLDVAARASGWQCEIRRMPEQHDPTYLAEIRFAAHRPTDVELRRARAITQRRTDRRQVSSWPVPAGRLEELSAIAPEYGVLARVVEICELDVVHRVLRDATELQNRNERYLDELFAWTHARAHEGVPAASLLTRAAAQGSPGSFSRFPAGELQDEYVEEAMPGTEWLVVATASDDIMSWLRAGEALAALWLECTISGLALVPYTQPVEVRSTYDVLQRDLLHGNSCPQLLLRLGWPPLSNKRVAATPRRGVDQVLQFRVAKERLA